MPSCLPRPGFTLIELTAVLALMAILAGVVTVNVRRLMIEGKQNAAKHQVATLCDAVEAFHTANNRYPTSQEGLAVLCEKSDAMPEPILKRVPVDPWGHGYQYNQPGRNDEPYEIICFGADGREGGSGANADIYSWSLQTAPIHGGGHAAGQ